MRSFALPAPTTRPPTYQISHEASQFSSEAVTFTATQWRSGIEVWICYLLHLIHECLMFQRWLIHVCLKRYEFRMSKI